MGCISPCLHSSSADVGQVLKLLKVNHVRQYNMIVLLAASLDPFVGSLSRPFCWQPLWILLLAASLDPFVGSLSRSFCWQPLEILLLAASTDPFVGSLSIVSTRRIHMCPKRNQLSSLVNGGFSLAIWIDNLVNGSYSLVIRGYSLVNGATP